MTTDLLAEELRRGVSNCSPDTVHAAEDLMAVAAYRLELLYNLLDAARICLQNRDQSERESVVYAAICSALAHTFKR